MRTTPFLVCSTLACLFWSGLQAAAPAEEAAMLGKTLTPVGAIRAGNESGSIPAWTGAANFPEESKHYTPEVLEDMRKNDPERLVAQFRGSLPPEMLEPIDVITKDNMAEHADRLTAGHQAMLREYPDFEMHIYRPVRGAFFPDEIYEETIKNASRATLEGTDSVKNAHLGFPFPIPNNGAEAIWNHKLKFRGTSARRYNNQAIVRPNGDVLLTKLTEDVKFKYANIDDPGDGKLFAYYLSEVISPARVAGQITLVHETADQSSGGRLAWIFTPGLGRVNRAPQVGYDNPAVGTDNEQYNDQIDVFNGALDRYTWKLVGRKEMYIPYNAYELNSPLVSYDDVLTPNFINPDLVRYELHRVWVVEADLRDGVRHNFAKRRFYLDEDSWSIAVVDCYDARGELWKVQEAQLLTAPFIPTTTGSPELIYDLQTHRYFATALTNEDSITDFTRQFTDAYFTPSNLKRLARSR
ncbi:MAG: outer membrane lipoprotein-sorting protein [Xanthomonadales bacterium]|nr:outer membrane lipoprotein-sorting protein [Xanthomonadales bacterium]